MTDLSDGPYQHLLTPHDLRLSLDMAHRLVQHLLDSLGSSTTIAFSDPYGLTQPANPLQPATRTRQKPAPFARVRVFAVKGTG